MSSLRPLVPLFLAAAILLAGNGMQSTLIALRGADEGFTTSAIGLIGASYSIGFMAGSFLISPILRAVGHIRAFSALAAMGASGCLLLVILVDPLAWAIIRFLSGLCFAGLFATVDSWLNSGITNETRARVLSIYRLIDMVCVTGSQFLIPFFDISNFVVFSTLAIMISLSLVPISLADRSNPKPPGRFSFNPAAVWRLSPIACIGCVAIGLTSATFRMIGPIYAQSIGLPVSSIATFMGAGILGGTILQYPLGVLSDRHDRRVILIVASAGAALSGIFINTFAGTDPLLNYIGVFFFGAFSLPLYSLSAAHANDHAEQGQYVQVAAGLLFYWSIGATIGPYIASLLMQNSAPGVMFTYTSIVHASLIVITLWRMHVRAAVPASRRGRFNALLRTSLSFSRMASRVASKDYDREQFRTGKK